MNRVLTIGKIKEPPEVKAVGDSRVADFTVIEEDGQEWRVSAWRDMADAVPPAGSFVIVEGKRTVRRWNKDNDPAQPRTSYSITASTVVPMPGQNRPTNAYPAPQPAPQVQQPAPAADTEFWA